MAKLYSLKAAFRRKKGFSLIAVMILSLINLAIMGVALQFAVSSSGGGRVNSAMAVKYNLLQNALEEGKALLKESMKEEALPRWYTDKDDISPESDITYPDMLLPACFSDYAQPKKIDLQRIGIFGKRGELTVKIYDMQYDPGLVKINPEDLQSMPPAMSLSGVGDWEEGLVWDPNAQSDPEYKRPADYAGVYLIRAELSVYDTDEVHDTDDPIHTWSLETSVVQANNKYK